MRRISIVAGIMMMLACASCSKELGPDIPDAPEESIIVDPGRPIGISARIEASATKTVLEGQRGLWQAGDAFSLLTAKSGELRDVLIAKVDVISAGLGIPFSGSSASVKYDGIKLQVEKTKTSGNGKKQQTVTTFEDVTSEICSVPASSSNSYNVGIYNSNSQYQFAPAGSVVPADAVSVARGAIPLVQASSKSSVSPSQPLYVQLKGVQFGSGEEWNSFDESSPVSNGYSGKTKINFAWAYEMVDDPRTLKYSETGELIGPGAYDPATNEKFTSGVAGKFNGLLKYEALEHYAVYPYSEAASFDGRNIQFSMPQSQAYAAGSFAGGANPMVGKLESAGGEDYYIQFRNMCGVLKLSMTGSKTVTSVKVIDKNDSFRLWGTASVDVARLEDGAVLSGGTNSVTLDCGEGVVLSPDSETDFHVVVPTGAFATGLTVEIGTPEGVISLSTSGNESSNTIARNDIKSLPVIPLDLFEISTEFNIENPAVHEYMEKSTTTLSSTAGNYGQVYFDQNRTYRPDQPNVMEISFRYETGAKVVMATDPAYEEIVLEETLPQNATSYTLRNFVPGKMYYYKVVAGAKVLAKASFKAVGQMRMIAVENGFNIRDLGGWTGLGGKKVRYEAIYRGGSLGGSDMAGNKSDIPLADKEELHRIGIRAQLDLRAATNSGKYTGESSLHSYSRGETTLMDADFNNTMTDYGAYNQDASVVSDIAWIIYELRRGKPVYFNCRQGADRTGTIAFVIEGLLGCYGNDQGRQMGMDYELTGFSQANLVDNIKVGTSYRGATEAYGNSGKLFYQLLNLDPSGVQLSNLQEKCYYYLNRGKEAHISPDDLDWFIMYMLGLNESEYTRPTFAAPGDDLKTVAEKCCNVVSYVN